MAKKTIIGGVRVVQLYAVPAGSALNLAERILNDRASSNWLIGALAAALRRDIVDSVHDCELLLSILTARLEEIQNGEGFTSPLRKSRSATNPGTTHANP